MSQPIACGVYTFKPVMTSNRHAIRDAHNGRFMRSVASKGTETPKQDEKPNQGQPEPSPADMAKAFAILSILLLTVYHIIYVRFFLL